MSAAFLPLCTHTWLDSCSLHRQTANGNQRSSHNRIMTCLSSLYANDKHFEILKWTCVILHFPARLGKLMYWWFKAGSHSSCFEPSSVFYFVTFLPGNIHHLLKVSQWCLSPATVEAGWVLWTHCHVQGSGSVLCEVMVGCRCQGWACVLRLWHMANVLTGGPEWLLKQRTSSRWMEWLRQNNMMGCVENLL